MAVVIKKRKISRSVNAQARAKQFPDDFYADDEDEVMFCKFCKHSVDYVRIDTVKDHIVSKKHLAAKDKQQKASNPKPIMKQKTLLGMESSRKLREEFVMDFVEICAAASIPLEKADKIKPFLEKYAKQGGSLPQKSTLRQVYLPRVFLRHYNLLKAKLQGQDVSLVADETTDGRDKSVVCVLAITSNDVFLIHTAFMEACNHGTLSQAIIKGVHNAEIPFERVVSIVTDSAAYCKKAFREILHTLFYNAVHVLCLAHVVNLVANAFVHHKNFAIVNHFIAMMKSTLFKKPSRKRRLVEYFKQFLPSEVCTIPPEAVKTRWNSWLRAVIFHSTHVQVYEGFFKAEKANSAMATEEVLALVSDKKMFQELVTDLHFLAENCQRLMSVQTQLETTKSDTLAPLVFNMLTDLASSLSAGVEKKHFGKKTDEMLSKLNSKQKDLKISQYQNVFKCSRDKLSSLLDAHPTFLLFKKIRVFDPRQLPTVSHDINDYERIHGIKICDALVEEFSIYTRFQPEHIPTPLNLKEFWCSQKQRFPLLAPVALSAVSMPVCSVDVERCFSLYKNMLTDRRHQLSEETTAQLLAMYFNS